MVPEIDARFAAFAAVEFAVCWFGPMAGCCARDPVLQINQLKIRKRKTSLSYE
jgi:hypothetical protein